MLRKIWHVVKSWIDHLDPILFVCSLLLSFFGILTIFGAVDNFGKIKLVMQIAMTLAGIVLCIVISNLNMRVILDKIWIILIVVSVGLLALTLIFGNSGAARETSNKSWLKLPFIGFSIQPSEFVKVFFICTFANHLSMVRRKINHPLTLLGLMAHALVIVGPILLSGDLGVALIYVGIILLMLFCAGLNLWYFAGTGVLGVILCPIIWPHLSDYQQKRILYGFRPELDPLKYGYQPLLSRTAIANGGVFGRGLLKGGYYERLPASHTDFIFATICEKFGFAGGIFVIACYVALVLRLILIALRSNHSFGTLVCSGIIAVFLLQVVENIGMCLAILPVVGVTLPFLSCGGSSMLATFLLIGLGNSIATHNEKSDCEHEAA